MLLIVVMSVSDGGRYYIPEKYGLFWGYVAISYLIATRKIGALVPGGLSFFVFSLIVIFISRKFDLQFFKKFMKIVAVIAAILFIGQEIMWYTTGTRFVPFMPLGKLTTTMTYQELIQRNLEGDRSSSIFLEPSHFALYLLMALAVDTLTIQGKKFMTKYGLFLVAILLLLRSGTGLVGLIVITLFRLSSFLNKFSRTKKILVTALMALVVAGAATLYIRTEVGGEMFERSQSELTLDEEGHSYTRFVVGALIYSEMPMFNKLVGMSDEEMLPIAKRFSILDQSAEDANILYMNGWANMLTHIGLVGLLLFLVVLWKLYRGNNDVSKCFIWLFVVISFFSQTYTQAIMLIMLIVSAYYQWQNKRIKIYAQK